MLASGKESKVTSSEPCVEMSKHFAHLIQASNMP